jgi:hypothetical protein
MPSHQKKLWDVVVGASAPVAVESVIRTVNLM